jgi:uncharacterized protein with FMN-binding domain
MKKTVVSFSFIFVFVMYALYQYLGMSQTSVFVATNSTASSTSIPPLPSASKTTAPVKTVSKTSTTVKKSAVPAAPSTTDVAIQTQPNQPVTTATPVPVVKSMYADGTYTGNAADAYYGTIQVQAIVQNGKLTDVQFLQYPSDRNRSVSINTFAMPILRSEAISAQNANVDIVSGATDSSLAFEQSLGSALSQALN